jgi:hypothetical protein|tara:strand:+ start:373 stop:819 length:447 start_codon:yes stop_codon:yes gene_type:complete
MIIVDIKLDNKTKKEFKKLSIDKNQLNSFCNFIINEYKKTRKIWNYNLDIKGMNEPSSGYYFDHNEMELSLLAPNRGIKKKREWVLSSFFHEFRHFMQDNIDKVSGRKMNYSEEDVEKCSNKYYYNKYEVEARKFEEKYTKIYLELFY